MAERGDRRYRGRALLAARRSRLPGDRPRAVPGHLEGAGSCRAARRSRRSSSATSTSATASDAVAQAQGGLPRREGLPEAVAEADPRRLPQRGLLRAARVRRRSGRADVLLEERLRALPRPGSAARRPASGADDGRPDPVQAGCPGEAERSPEGDVEERLHHRREASPRGEETASPEARSPLHAAPPAELLRLGHAAAGRYIQPAAGGAGRAQGEDDARHPPAGARAPRNQRRSPHVHGSRCGARRDRSAHRRREGDGRLPPERTQDAVQLRNAGPPLDRKLLQADHACDGAERGRLAVLDVLRTARAPHHHPGVPGQERVPGTSTTTPTRPPGR